jgi:hypothetical protein
LNWPSEWSSSVPRQFKNSIHDEINAEWVGVISR